MPPDRRDEQDGSARARVASRFAPWLVLVVGVALSVGSFAVIETGTNRDAERRFRETTGRVAEELVADVERYETVLDGLSGLFATDSFAVSQDDFVRYVDSLLLPARFPGAFGLAWVRSVPSDQLAGFLAANDVAEAPEPEYAPGQLDTSYLVTHAAPLENLSIARGVDARLFPEVGAALEVARDRGTIVVGERFAIPLQEAVTSSDDLPVMFVIVVPVYADDAALDTVDQRREAIRSWAGVIVDAGRFVEQALGARAADYRVELFDGEHADRDRLLASTHPEASGASRTITAELYERTWTIRVTELTAVQTTASTSVAVLVAGLIVSVLLFALVFVVTRSERRAVRMVDEATAELARQERHFRALVANSNDLVVVTDGDLVIRYASPAAQRLLGVPDQELVGVDASSLVVPGSRVSEDGPVVARVLEQGRAGPFEFRLHDASGAERWFEGTVVDLREDDAVRGLVWTVRDITERHHFQRDLARQATHDHLTGLPNRTLLLDRLEQAVARAERGEAGPAVLFVDLDRFKLVNDSFGHGAGDTLLVAVADRLRRNIRPGDTLARFGGDEFVVLADAVTTAEECASIADRLSDGLAAPFVVAGHEVFVTASIGMVLADRDARAEDLLQRADVAMYRAKERGRGHRTLFDAGSLGGRTRFETEHELRAALERDELVLHYQPIVDLASGRRVGVEALLRWHHPRRGLLTAREFLDVAEDTGLMRPIGRWVLRTACADGYRWLQSDPVPTGFSVSVNLSAAELADPDLVATVRSALAESGLPAEALRLELTEGSLMADVDTTVRTLGALRDLGVRLAIDDFGTGYASLGHLKRFPVDGLKIDRTFVAGLGHDPDDTVIVAAVIGLAHALGVTATAEGVESAEQLAELRALGCDAAQGWHFGRPVPAAEIDGLRHGEDVTL